MSIMLSLCVAELVRQTSPVDQRSVARHPSRKVVRLGKRIRRPHYGRSQQRIEPVG